MAEFAMAEQVTCRPSTAHSTAQKTETDPARIAEPLANSLRAAGYECVVALPKIN